MSNLTPRSDDFQGTDSNEARMDILARFFVEIPIAPKQRAAVAVAFNEEVDRLHAKEPMAAADEIYRQAFVTALFGIEAEIALVPWGPELPQKIARLGFEERYQLQEAMAEALEQKADLALMRLDLY